VKDKWQTIGMNSPKMTRTKIWGKKAEKRKKTGNSLSKSFPLFLFIKFQPNIEAKADSGLEYCLPLLHSPQIHCLLYFVIHFTQPMVLHESHSISSVATELHLGHFISM
jgi:hypothetical protein